MFAIATEERQYRTYVLSDQTSGASVEVVPERGGIITRWQMQGKDLLYMDHERYTNPALSVRGGIPILFPICGNLPDNTYLYKGHSYSLKQHGFAREMPWTVVEQSDENGASLSLELTSNAQTLLQYPFEFQVVFTYILRGNQLTLRQRYTNHSADTMPFATGFHPYFWAQNKPGLQFEIPSTQFRDHRTQSVQSYQGSFDFEQDEIDVAFLELAGQASSVTDPERSLKLTLSFDKDFSILVFWTVKGKDFYCLEPWTAARNALNTGDRLIHLAPGTSVDTEFTLTAAFG